MTGTVTDPSGEPLIGVSVIASGGKTGTATDIDGNYTIKVDSKSKLTFSYIGYKTVEEAVNGRTAIDVRMEENSAVLDEVVVIGYGTMDKKELTSAISHVGEKDFLTVSSLDPSMMIQGKVPGVSITNTGAGDPNNQASIQIRGVSSRSAGLGPLIVIDGVPGGNLTNLNPNDIQSFDILKDGAASAIYGTRGSNGVILVTTKKGSKDGAVHTSYSAQLSWDKLKNELDMMDADDYRQARRHGLHCGAYHFYSVKSDAASQARYFIRNTFFRKGDFPPVLDVEPSNRQIMKMGGPAVLADAIRTWMRIVKQHTGVKPILYVNQTFVNKYLADAPDIKRDYNIWIARYGEYRPDVRLVYWQLCPDGKTNGIHGDVDINVFNGYQDKFDAFLETELIK